MKNKILLASPNSSVKNYCWNDWLDRARSFGVDIFISDNSLNDENKSLYEKHNIPYVWTNPLGKASFEYICESQNKIRDYFLGNNYTHLFFLETDLFPSKSILPLFECFDVPVVSSPYFIYKGAHTAPMNQEIRGFGDEALTRNYSLSESFQFHDGELKRCFSTGFGCTLIKREVLEGRKHSSFEGVKFRWIGDSLVVEDPSGGSHADSYFYADLQRLKIPSYLYMGTLVRHYNQDWSKIDLNRARNDK